MSGRLQYHGQGLLGDLGGGVRVLRGSLSVCYESGHACVVRGGQEWLDIFSVYD